MKRSHNFHKILEALMKSPKQSDRKIAKETGVSQPTATRTRAAMERAGLFTYSCIPDLAELGYEIVAMSEIPTAAFDFKELNAMLSKDDNVIFAMQGINGTYTLSKHKSFLDYAAFCQKYLITDSDIASTSFIVKNVTFSKP